MPNDDASGQPPDDDGVVHPQQVLSEHWDWDGHPDELGYFPPYSQRYDDRVYIDKVSFPLDVLTHHVTVVGSTGAGKTRTLKAILEECVRLGVPVLMFDLQGDICALARAVKGTPFERDSEIRVFTPGQDVGIPVYFSPFQSSHIQDRQASDYIAKATTTICGLLGYKASSAKNKAVHLLIQDIIRHSREIGAPLESFTDLMDAISDIENFGLKLSDYSGLTKRTLANIRTDIRFLSRGPISDIFNYGLWLNIEILLHSFLDPHKVPVSILNLSNITSTKHQDYIIAWLLREIEFYIKSNPATETINHTVVPRLVVFMDEIDKLIPPGKKAKTDLTKNQLNELIQIGRKYGVGLGLSVHSLGAVDYKILNETQTKFIGGQGTFQAVDKVRKLAPTVMDVTSRRDRIYQIKGEFYVASALPKTYYMSDDGDGLIIKELDAICKDPDSDPTVFVPKLHSDIKNMTEDDINELMDPLHKGVLEMIGMDELADALGHERRHGSVPNRYVEPRDRELPYDDDDDDDDDDELSDDELFESSRPGMGFERYDDEWDDDDDDDDEWEFQCPYCGGDVEEDSDFCPSCMERFEPERWA